jgi:hypothetical protein
VTSRRHAAIWLIEAAGPLFVEAGITAGPVWDNTTGKEK